MVNPLYDRDRACSLRERELYFQGENRVKISLLLDHIGECERLVDIGCGWGQFLGMARAHVAEVWGVDESPERVRDIEAACPEARMVICRADRIGLPDGYFDAAVMSQMLHEVKLFGEESEEERVLGEVRRILAGGGRFLLLDHLDVGEGEVVVRLPEEKIRLLLEFERRFRFYPASHCDITSNRDPREVANGPDPRDIANNPDCRTLGISKRCLQDYLTKDWSFDSPMESIEMDETHNVFERAETIRQVESAGLSFLDWVPFSDIRADLERVGGELLEGEPWFRKFLLVAERR